MNKQDPNIDILYASLRPQRRKIGSISPQAFAEIYMENNCSEPFSQMHKKVFNLLYKMTRKRKARLAIAAPRGHAKSTIVSLVYVLWCILYHKERLILITSNTSEQAIALLKDIKHQLRHNPLIVSDFPEICLGKMPKPWRDNKIQLPNGPMICVYGAGQNPRGIKHDKDRPGLIICDDLENEELVDSEEQRDKLRSWFSGTLLNTGHPNTNVIVVGTILNHDSLLANLVDHERSPGWQGKTYKAIKQFSDNPKYWEEWSAIYRSRAEFIGRKGPKAAKLFFMSNKEKMLKGTKVLWPQWENYYDLMVLRETEGDIFFQREKQNCPLDPRQCIFKKENIIFWDDEFKETQHLIGTVDRYGSFFGACDPGLGSSSKTDFTAIIILLKDNRTKILYLIAADMLHCTPDQSIQRIIQYADIYRFSEFAVESNNFQQLMVDDLKRRLSENGHKFYINALNHTSHKHSRICSLEPYISQGLLRFSRKHIELLQQLTQFPLAKNDDGPDALEMAVDIARKQMPAVSVMTF